MPQLKTDRHCQATSLFAILGTRLESTDLVQTDDDQPAVCHFNPEWWEQVMATVFTIGGRRLVRQELVTSSDIINQLTCTVTIITFGWTWSTVWANLLSDTRSTGGNTTFSTYFSMFSLMNFIKLLLRTMLWTYTERGT
jgi:hypothetical protein